ncbi:DNA polymerase III subunit gamma/tau [Alkalicaulis satelles]|uniref:DNA polymerase III subunit gamma/tau n=1 Tax=Alkalicaulis satelles TaxID=2609175 RepID=A0A5M6ZNI6_9PROT|nr:DNA polymerase III subunit gamma/tau [Alkalicaulis satelles]KAA5804798.1 DNA polymerase III subunit gamma/tau [Alkalicaulis satelles]
MIDDADTSNEAADGVEDASAPDGPALPGFEAPPAPDPGYQVLARKYRPQTFPDLIGQEPMVRTLTHAFAAGRIAHAYMLTGVRGVGKTTTARLIARALNYETDEVKAPSITLDPPGRHCQAIARSSHVDVMEMDAASRTGVGDIREILDGVRYAPVSARFKVYIIDEVHMLSTSAFNALLKTLEEPPPHVKFIFATTEIRKVPVTVLSRCQRFDLRRVERDELAGHLAGICRKEGAEVEAEGLAAIARAAEGSVRDALSLLDQAIVQAEGGGPVTAAQVRDMLGLADRSRVLDLLAAALEHRAGDALAELRHQYDAGADPFVLMRDLLDYLHAMTRLKAAGASADLGEARETTERLEALSAPHSIAALGRLWKTALTGLDDVRQAPDPAAAVEMAVIRLMSAASLPSPEDAARLIAGLAPSASPAPSRPAPDREGEAAPAGSARANVVPLTRPPEPEPDVTDDEDGGEAPLTGVENDSEFETLEDLTGMLERQRDIGLQLDVERYVRLVSLRTGALVFEPAPGAPSDLGARLSRSLQDYTGHRWLVDASVRSGGAPSIHERRQRRAEAERQSVLSDAGVARALEIFPGAELIGVEGEAAPERAASDRQETKR